MAEDELEETQGSKDTEYDSPEKAKDPRENETGEDPSEVDISMEYEKVVADDHR